MKKIITIAVIIAAAVTLVGCQSTSLTGQAVSTITDAPKILAYEPGFKDKGVAVDVPVKITFDRSMQQETINNRSISIEYVEDLGYNYNPFLNSEYKYDETTNILTIVPAENFQPGQEVMVVIREGILDQDGKELSPGEIKFTTGE